MGYAVERMGGTAQDAQASIDAMSRSLYKLHTQGQALPAEIYRLSSLSGMKIDTEHGVTKFLDDIAAAAQKLSQTDMTQAHYLLSGAGINDATANAMIKFGAGFSEVGKSLAPTKDAIKAAQDLTEQFARAQESIQSLGNSITTQLDPPLSKALGEFSNWVAANKELVATDISTWVDNQVKSLEGFENLPWAKITADAQKLADVLNTINKGSEILGGAVRGDTTHGNFWELFGPGVGNDLGNPFDWLKKHNPFDISAHAGELPPEIDEGAFESRRAKAQAALAMAT